MENTLEKHRSKHPREEGEKIDPVSLIKRLLLSGWQTDQVRWEGGEQQRQKKNQ